jgi:hypothetical protein
VSVQDRCMVYAKHTIDLEIILDAPDGTPRWRAHVVSRFGTFRDSVSVVANLVSFHLETVLVSVQDRSTVCTKRTIGIEIVLDEADGTPR